MRTYPRKVVISLLGAAMLLTSFAPATRARPESPAQDSPNLLAAPASGLLFIENAGQFAPAARFRVWGGGNLSWLAENALWVTMLEGQPTSDDQRPSPDGGYSSFVPGHSSSTPVRGFNIKVSFAGANPRPVLEPFERRETRVSYFLGDDPAGWRPDVPVWGGVRYRDLYPGVDLEVFSENGSWAWQVVLHPEAGDAEHALSLMRLQIEGTPSGAVTLPALQVGGFSDSADQYSSENSTLPVIPLDDPGDLVYGTFLGGSRHDEINALAVDAAGSAYVTGYTNSSDFPTTPGAFDTDLAEQIDVFVAKFTPDGSDLEYATFLGENGWEKGEAIAVDEPGHAFVSGTTTSTRFPTVAGSYDTSYNGNEDLFLVKLAPAGDSLVYSSFLGGGERDHSPNIAVDAAGRAFLAGITMSSDFPTTGDAFSPTYHRLSEGIVLQFNAPGTALNYSTFLGGDHDDRIEGMVVDGQGNAYLTGYTQSEDFPITPGAVDPIYDQMDAFVTKLNPTGSSLVYSTYLGGNSHDQGFGIDIDGDGRAYVVGLTYSTDFPVTPDAYDEHLSAQADGFLAWIDPLGSQLEYATFLGKTSSISAYNVVVDGSGFVYILGASGTASAPTTPGAFDRSFNGEVDLYLMKLSPSGTCLSYATFLGGNLYEAGAFVVEGEGTVYIAGWTDSVGFPVTPGAFDTLLGGLKDGFMDKLTLDAGVNVISGTVVDGEGHPLPGFPVAESCGSSTTTGADGQYQLNGLYRGEHTVTPVDIHFHYDPPSRMVNLPPDAAAVDFTALPRFVSFLPYTSRPCLPVYFDGFEDVASGWPVYWGRDFTLEYLGGEYRIALHNDYSWVAVSPGVAFADFNLSAEMYNATRTYGTYGLVFGITPDWSQFYTYEIDTEGNFGLFRYDGSWTVIVEGHSPALFGGAITNTLRVVKTATRIELYANGQLIAERVMSTFTEARYVGLIVSTYTDRDVDVRIDNYTVYNPGCGAGVETAGQAASLPALADWLFGENDR